MALAPTRPLPDVFHRSRRYLFEENGRVFTDAPYVVKTTVNVLLCGLGLFLFSILFFIYLRLMYHDGFSAGGIDGSIALFTVCYWLWRGNREGK